MKTSYLSVILLASIFLACCNNPQNTKAVNAESPQPEISNDSLRDFNNSLSVTESSSQITYADSVALLALVKHAYGWRITKFTTTEFPYKYRSSRDSIFTGIDWSGYDERVEILRETGFFAEPFFIKHRQLAASIDSSIRKADIKWRNINDGIPLWQPDADDWCRCQDNPDDYWELMTLNSFHFDNDELTFNWSWGPWAGNEPNKYKMKAKKENGLWKISYMDGFEHYGTVADYDRMMAPRGR